MKKVLIALFIITSITATAQESVLLRLNYTKGDSFLIKVESKQIMELQGGKSMNMEMGMIITEVNDENIKTESKILSVAIDMMQGGMPISYDSNKKEEELDQMGQMMKSHFDPMMKATIYTTLDNLGNMIDSKIDPSIPGMEEITSSPNAINYPKEKVSVGSSWTSENENQGTTMTITYTVSRIADGIVFLDVTGNLNGSGTGSIKGKTQVDISTGISNSAELEVTIAAQNMDMTVSTRTTMSKI